MNYDCQNGIAIIAREDGVGRCLAWAFVAEVLNEARKSITVVIPGPVNITKWNLY